MRKRTWIPLAFITPVCMAQLSGRPAPAVLGVAVSPSIKPPPSDGIIVSPGQYQLQQDLVIERDTGIRIEADDVALDLGGHTLRYDAEPREGTYGVVANTRRNIRITNGTISGFWFNIHCLENQGLRIDHVRFDGIAYIAANVADSRNVLISDNTFTHFRYDLHRAERDHYVIGINMGAQDVVITQNRFDAEYGGSNPRKLSLETVFVLFVADVSRRCVVTHNEMAANIVLDRSYGIWAASQAQITAVHNTIRNMKYGICVESDTTALAGFNHLSADPPPAGVPPTETYGIYAPAAKNTLLANNQFHGLTYPVLAPEEPSGKK